MPDRARAAGDEHGLALKGPSEKRQASAVIAGMPRQAPASKETPSGSAAASRRAGRSSPPRSRMAAAIARSTARPARRCAPCRRPARPPRPRRRRRCAGRCAGSPPAARACPALHVRGVHPRNKHAHQHLAGPGAGLGSASTCRTSRAGPFRSYQAAFIFVSPARRRARRPSSRAAGRRGRSRGRACATSTLLESG